MMLYLDIDQRRSKLLVIGTAVTMAMVFGKEMDRVGKYYRRSAVNWSSLVLVFHCLSHHLPTPGTHRPWKVCPGWVAPCIASASKSISFCGMLKSLFMFMSSGLSTLTGQHAPSSHTSLVPVIHDECVLALGHPLQLVPSCRNVGAHWYLHDSHPDQDLIVCRWSRLGIHKHKPSYSHPSLFSTAIVNLVTLLQENFSLFLVN
eukprot:scaffold23143_cov92-Skeletonema_dohrnii-CCMP3373.AAC.3